MFQLGDVGQLLAELTAGHGANRVDARQVGFGGFLEDVFGDARVVVHRHGVRHAGHGCEAAGHGRRRPGCHGLLVLLSRLAQVHVHVDEARTDNQAARNLRHDHVAVSWQIPVHACDAIAVDQHVEYAVAAVRGIDDPAAFE